MLRCQRRNLCQKRGSIAVAEESELACPNYVNKWILSLWPNNKGFCKSFHRPQCHKTQCNIINDYVLYKSKCKKIYIWKTTESQNPFLSCLSEEEYWCKKLVRSYKPHKLYYLTSNRLLFTQNGPWLKQKLEGSLETMGREDENDEEGKDRREETEKKT